MSSHHGHGHGHGHDGPIAIGQNAARIVIGTVVALGVVVLAGLVILWPSQQTVDIPLPFQNASGGAVVTEAATVVGQSIGPCGSPSAGRVFGGAPTPPPMSSYDCTRSVIAIESGPNAGTKTLFEIAPGPGQPDLRVGDNIRVVRGTDASGTTIYGFDDYARGFPLLAIVLVFALVIIVVARWRGFRALLGLLFTFAVVVTFLLPALLDGKPAIPVALVAGGVILYVVLYLAHGVSMRTSSALLGTLAAMLLAAVLSWATIRLTHLTGLSEEQNTNVATYLQHVSITGLLLAGFIIGTIGVLNDVTITQASAAFELAALDPDSTRRTVFTATMRVGRDHIASTVYTLVFAYAGGALPLLLLFSVAGRSVNDVLVGDAVAIEIARSAVGGIALALSVPLTTGIAVILARPFGTLRAGRTAGTSRADSTARPARTGATPRVARTEGMPRSARTEGTPRSARYVDDERTEPNPRTAPPAPPRRSGGAHRSRD
ncbi:YibE/F family protein [Aldersonia kunmingensis]|uniref:YibE/F family protein n=1 Tax=Aldersonia kunmingensis TaxID=408066 RepID=UPI0009FBAF03|nr:YibE/F family protein [Aldersonia kunmingensis]